MRSHSLQPDPLHQGQAHVQQLQHRLTQSAFINSSHTVNPLQFPEPQKIPQFQNVVRVPAGINCEGLQFPMAPNKRPGSMTVSVDREHERQMARRKRELEATKREDCTLADAQALEKNFCIIKQDGEDSPKTPGNVSYSLSDMDQTQLRPSNGYLADLMEREKIPIPRQPNFPDIPSSQSNWNTNAREASSVQTARSMNAGRLSNVATHAQHGHSTSSSIVVNASHIGGNINVGGKSSGPINSVKQIKVPSSRTTAIAATSTTPLITSKTHTHKRDSMPFLNEISVPAMVEPLLPSLAMERKGRGLLDSRGIPLYQARSGTSQCLMPPAPHVPPPPKEALANSCDKDQAGPGRDVIALNQLKQSSGRVHGTVRSSWSVGQAEEIAHNKEELIPDFPETAQHSEDSDEYEKPDKPLSAPVSAKALLSSELKTHEMQSLHAVNSSNTAVKSIVHDDLEYSEDDSSKSRTESESSCSDSEESSSSSDHATDKVQNPEPERDEEGKEKKESMSWALSKLFVDDAEKKEKPDKSSSNVTGASIDRKNNRNGLLLKSPRTKSFRSKFSRELSEGSSDEKPVVRPTPQVAAAPRPLEHRKCSLSSDSDSSIETPVVDVHKKGVKRVKPLVKSLPANAKPSKMVKKTKPGRGRPRKTTTRADSMNSKAKSRAFVSSDSDSDSETENKQPSLLISKKAKLESYQMSSNAVRSSAASKRLPRHNTTLPCIHESTKKAVTACYKTEANSNVIKPNTVLMQPESLPSVTNYSLFIWPVIPAQTLGSLEVKTANEDTNLAQPSDPNKKKWLGMLYRHKKNKEDKCTEQKIVEMEKDLPLLQPSKCAREQSPAEPVITYTTDESSNRPRSVNGRKRKDDKVEKCSHVDEKDTVPRNKRSKVLIRANETVKASSSRSSSRSTTPVSQADANVAAALKDSRVPVEGESSDAFNTRQSSSTSSAQENKGRLVEQVPSGDQSSIRRFPSTPTFTGPASTPTVNNEAKVEVHRDAECYLIISPLSRLMVQTPVKSVYPSIGELEGKSINDVFRILFGNDATEVANEATQYLGRAVKLKRIADDMTSAYRSTKYLEAVLYFILNGFGLEENPSQLSEAITMYSGTMNVIRYVYTWSKRSNEQQKTNAKIYILCLLCQCILSQKLFYIKKRELRDCERAVAQYLINSSSASHHTNSSEQCARDNIMGHPCYSQPGGQHLRHSAQTGSHSSAAPSSCATAATHAAGDVPAVGHIPAANSGEANCPPAQSPSDPSSTPSPASSHTSESSHSSGYLTSNAGPNSMPSPPQPPLAAVQQQDIVNQFRLVCEVNHHLSSSHDMWMEAKQLVAAHKLEMFFGCLDKLILSQSVQHNMVTLVCYVMAGLREIESEISRSVGSSQDPTAESPH